MLTLPLALWISLTITHAEPAPVVCFDTEVIPVLTKAGCNAGSCHGAAAGRGGFTLSLFGSEPSADYDSIVHALEGRRINLAQPEKSLLIRKPTGQTDHGGEVLWDEEDPSAIILLNWIRAGAPRVKAPQLIHLTIERTPLSNESNAPQTKLRALATFDDRLVRDVTPWVVFTTTDLSAISVGDNHVVTAHRPGQHTIIARYLSQVIPLVFRVPFATQPSHVERRGRNFIDDSILQTLAEMRLAPAPPAEASTWYRRVHLDLTGRLPEPEDLRRFLSDQTFNKRIKVIDRLLASDACLDYWTGKFARLLRMHSLPNEPEALVRYHAWLKDQLSSPAGWHEIAQQLILATGDTHQVGPANFARMTNNAREHAEHLCQCFAGIKLGCANCHNHPFDRWTQDDYHGFAALFAGIERGRAVTFVSTNAITHPRTGQPAVSRIPGLRDYPEPGDHRALVVEWLLATEHPYLAKAFVNRLWHAMFGRGFIAHPDDLRETNPPSHPELFEALTRECIAHDYDFRKTLRSIAISDTYARSPPTNSESTSDEMFYVAHKSKPLESEILLDAICDVTGVPHTNPRHSLRRAVQLVDAAAPDETLERLGRCSRLSGCEEEAGMERTLGGALHLMNGSVINEKLKTPGGRLQHWIADEVPTELILYECFTRALGRDPTKDELLHWQTEIDRGSPKERVQRLEDFMWSLLHSRAFRENH